MRKYRPWEKRLEKVRLAALRTGHWVGRTKRGWLVWNASVARNPLGELYLNGLYEGEYARYPNLAEVEALFADELAELEELIREKGWDEGVSEFLRRPLKEPVPGNPWIS